MKFQIPVRTRTLRPIWLLAREERPLRGPSVQSLIPSFLHIGHPASHVGRHGDVNLFGIGQFQIRHDLHEFVLGLGEPGIRGALGFDGARCARLVIVRRVDERLQGQRVEQLGMDGVVQRRGGTTLEVGAAAALDEQGIAREYHAPVVGDEADAAAGVARRGAHRYVARAELDGVAVLDMDVGLGAGSLGDDALQARQFGFEDSRARDVIGMRVGVDAVLEVETGDGLDGLHITIGLDVDGIDEDGILRGWVPNEVGVGAGIVIEELLETERFQRRIDFLWVARC
mmetsp:Transcript_2299/g.6352  ORF Transcript_2299/g.6352 Transcript_2299/m.6352 type:complete len:285 (+) Transcript_2299:1215-2069(+)